MKRTPSRSPFCLNCVAHCVAAALCAALFLLTPPLAAAPDEPVDWETVAKIRNEGLERSQIAATLGHLTDAIGPRLTGSPAMRQANEWTKQQLEAWGMQAQLEPWGPFGRGWSFSSSSLRLLEPRATPLHALPKAWTPGTGGPQRGEAVRASFSSKASFEKWRGKLSGKVVLLSADRDLREDRPAFSRYDHEELAELVDVELATGRGRSPDRLAALRRRIELRSELRTFLRSEGVLATLEMSDRDNGIVRVTGGGSREVGEHPGVPSLVVAAEHYRLLARLLERSQPVVVEVDVQARFDDDDLMGYNTVGELSGGDLAHQVVMVGAHLDSWHTAAGSNDNAAGVAVAMEAMRILAAIDARPRRTMRVGLWSGEEQGLLGARAHVARHYAERPENTDPETKDLPSFLQPAQWPITYKPAWEDFQAYFNLDNGSGKIRGIYTQSNAALVPIFSAWLEPLHDLGADTVTNRNTRGTDHQAFDAVALPGFQFIQDQLDYSSRTHHTHLDHFDHARIEDLRQAAVVMATFAYHAAMREDLLPRKARPRPPEESPEGSPEGSAQEQHDEDDTDGGRR